jgi:hypothetical protein
LRYLLANNNAIVQVPQAAKADTVTIAGECCHQILAIRITEDAAGASTGDDVSAVGLNRVTQVSEVVADADACVVAGNVSLHSDILVIAG